MSLRLSLLALVATAASTLAQSPAAFTLDPKTLLQQAQSVSTDKSVGVVVLLNEDIRTFGEDSKIHRTYRAIFVVQNQQGIDAWSTIEKTWEPWHEKRPLIEARVITPDGIVHKLDPATITDGPAREDSAGTFSDSRLVKCPLPAVVAGSVVEEQITTDDIKPEFPAGLLTRIYFGRTNARVLESAVVLHYPASLHLRYEAQQLPDLKIQSSASGLAQTLEFHMGVMDQLASPPALLPANVSFWPSIVLSTGSSWSAVAKSYNEIVEAKLGGKIVETVAAEAVSGQTTRDAKVAAILRAIQRQVRYTGVEFSEAAIVPARPDETWERKYGDCKDKATLLVALLRAQNIPAFVALLATGPGQDVDQQHAGLGYFDHAIVYVPAADAASKSDAAMWLDATDQFGQPGGLPAADQGRMALIISDSTQALTRTAELNAAADTLAETREMFLPEMGNARIVETTEGTGNSDSYYRNEFGFEQTAELKKSLTSYMHDEYLSKGTVNISHGSGDNFSKPFQLRLEVLDAKRGIVDETGAYAALNLASLTDRLPTILRATPDAAEKDDRKYDFEIPQAFVTVRHYRIHLPAGYQAKGVPDSTERELGPAHFTSHYKINGDMLEADFSFSIEHRTLSAAQGIALRKAVVEFRNQPVVTLTFMPHGRILLQAGKVREGLAALHAACQANPSAAVPHIQYSAALLEEGMGESARAEALIATRLDPKLGAAWRNLGYALLQDLIGRQFAPGFDAAGAEAALRKAIALDDKDATARRNLAIVFEYNSAGDRYVSKPRLEEAIKVYRSFGNEDLISNGLADNLLFALAHAGHFQELKDETAKFNPGMVVTGLRLLAISQLSSTAAAINESRSLLADEATRSSALATASNVLVALRRYEDAADLLAAAAAGSPSSNQLSSRASVYRQIKAVDTAEIRPNTAENTIILMNVGAISDMTFEQFKSLVSSEVKEFYSEAEMERIFEITKNTNHAALLRSGVSARTLSDLIVSLVKIKLEPNGQDGVRALVTPPGLKTIPIYLVVEDGVFKIFDIDSTPRLLAFRAFSLATSNPTEERLASARQILDWVREVVKPAGGDDSLASEPFTRFWTKGQKASAEEIKLAAATIAISDKSASRVLPVLEMALNSHLDSERQAALETAFVRAAIAGNASLTKAEPIALKLTKDFGSSPEAATLYMRLLVRLNRFSEAEAFGLTFAQAQPDDLTVYRLVVNCYQQEKRFKEASALLQKLTLNEKSLPGDMNNCGWDAVLAGAVTPEMIDTVQRVANNNGQNISLIHTLAMMYAEAGRGREARAVVAEAIKGWGLTEPNSEVMLVYGRIAQSYGLDADARSAYKRVNSPPLGEPFFNMTSYAIAQEQLKTLQK